MLFPQIRVCNSTPIINIFKGIKHFKSLCRIMEYMYMPHYGMFNYK